MTSGVSLGADYWRGMIERQQRSGLSISEFCRRVEVSDFTFRRWKQRLAEAPRFQELIVASNGPAGTQRSDSQSAFIEIVLAEQVMVRVPMSAMSLTEILRSAKEAAC